MDVIQIGGTFWRHKWVTLPVVALTIVLLGYVTVVKPKQYTADAAYMLIPPGASATNQTTGGNANVTPSNPYVRFGDLSVIVSMLTEQMSTDPVHSQIVKQGADPGFAVAQDVNFGAAPILQITGDGASASSAVASAQIAGRGAIALLRNLQAEQHVGPRYRITMLPLSVPQATLKASSLVRSAVAVLAVGGILLAIALSIASGISDLRGRRRAVAAQQAADVAELDEARLDEARLDDSRLTRTGSVRVHSQAAIR